MWSMSPPGAGRNPDLDHSLLSTMLLLVDIFYGNRHIHTYHYNDVIMTTMTSQITSLTVVYSTVYSDADKKKTSKLRVTGLCVGNSPGPVNSPHKGQLRGKSFHLMTSSWCCILCMWENMRVSIWYIVHVYEMTLKKSGFSILLYIIKMPCINDRHMCISWHISLRQIYDTH